MTNGTHIISKLTFDNLEIGPVPQPFYDNNKYTNIEWSRVNTTNCTIEIFDGTKYVRFNGANSKIYTTNAFIKDFNINNFEVEFDIIFDTLKAESNLFALGGNNETLNLRLVASTDSTKGLCLIQNTIQIKNYYKFENNKKYTICFSKINDIYYFYVDGLCIGYRDVSLDTTKPTIPDTSQVMFACSHNSLNDATKALYGKIANVNFSYGQSVKHYNSYTKYGNKLISHLKIDNLNLTSSGTIYKVDLNTIKNDFVWSNIEQITYSSGYGKVKNLSITINSTYTLLFDTKKITNFTTELLSYGDYKVIINLAQDGIEKEPEVIVNEYTTSALNFENGIVDQVSTTVWTKEGTADITSINKIFGENSFETKALGDSLYTNTKAITGGSTPFTLEFYALIKSGVSYNNFYDGTNNGLGSSGGILSQYRTGSDAEQNLSFYDKRLFFYRGTNGSTVPSIPSTYLKSKLSFNDINKYTISYDGSALRLFVNDKLDTVLGSTVGWDSNTDRPLKFLDVENINNSNIRIGAKGIIDNINIHDGVATKVRDTDPYEEFLVVDLAFDGENNSTKIVDNGGDVLRSSNPYNNNIISLLHFEGIDDSNIIIDETGRIWNILGSSKIKTDQKVIGSSSCYFDGNSSVSSSLSSDFAYGTGNFTWEFFTRLNVIKENQYFIDHRQSNGNDGTISYYQNTLRYYNPTIGINSPLYNTNISLDINKWYHIAIVRNNNITSIYVDGIIRAAGTDSHNFGNMECWLGTYSRGGNSLNGYIDEFRIIKGKAVYTENFTPPTEPFKYIPINKWTTNGNAKISTDQKFDGFSSLYLPDFSSTITSKISFNFSNDWTVSFQFKSNVEPDSGIDTPFFKNITDDFMFGVTNNGSQHKFQFIKSGVRYIFDYITWFSNSTKIHNITIIKKVNSYSLYINNKFIEEKNFNIGDNFSDNISLIISPATNNGRSFIGYYKNFKMYEGVAVIPEDSTGKIQLNFDNNVIDKYGNSTWTNNGLVFDQINSIKGYSAKADGSLYKNIYSNSLTLNLKNNIYDFDFKVTDVNDYRIITGNKYLFIYISKTNANVYFEFYNNGAWITGYTSNVKIELNKWYNLKFVSLNDKIFVYINDIICDVIQTPYINLTMVQDVQYISGSYGQAGYMYSGYIDNFRFENNTVINIDNINKPAVYLPLETNAINTGFTPLTINSVGNPIYTTIDGKKCIKFESGKYLTINSNNIFNLGTNSDFYIEFEFYPLDIKSSGSKVFFTSGANYASGALVFSIYQERIILQMPNFPTTNNIVVSSDVITDLNKFYKIKLARKGTIYTLSLDNSTYENRCELPFNLSVLTTIGTSYWELYNATANGYMSNFKMFVGTSQPPETYNQYKVLDLDFKPTRKSYLFKDNNDKCIIHPVNITQRDYQDSQYCCSFNGTNQYLQLGKNELFNFGLDDFIINIKFKINTFSGTKNGYLIASGNTTSNNADKHGIVILNDRTLLILYSGIGIKYNYIFNYNELYDLTVIRSNKLTQLYINGELYSDVNIIESGFNDSNFNLNQSNNTYIARNAWDANTAPYFDGTIYSIKVFRNTSDLSLLDDEEVIDNESTNNTISLTNGIDNQEIEFINNDNNEFKFIHGEDSVKLISNNEILEVSKLEENSSDELIISNDSNTYIKDVKLYNDVIEETDIFEGNIVLDTQFDGIDVEDITTEFDIFNVVDQGNFIIKGFFEGQPNNTPYSIRHKYEGFEMSSGIGEFHYNGIDKRYINDYVIINLTTNETIPVPQTEMIKGYINISVELSDCGQADFAIRVIRRLDNTIIGVYEFNGNLCNIPNLDCNKNYDCIIFDRNAIMESRSLSNRTPTPY